MTAQADLEGRVNALKEKTRSSSNESIEFSELRDVVLEVVNRDGDTLEMELEFGVLEDIAPSQVEGATALDYLDLANRTEDDARFTCELWSAAALHISVYEDEDEILEVLDLLEETDRLGPESVLNSLYTKRPDLLSECADRLLESENETAQEALEYLTVEFPEELKKATPEFFEKFKGGEDRDRILFCNFLAELSRINPEYAEEWVGKTLPRLDDEELEKKASESEKLRGIQECVAEMGRWNPGAAMSSLRDEENRMVGSVVNWERTRWYTAPDEEHGRDLEVRIRLKHKEYSDLRATARENDETARDVIEGAVKRYITDEQEGDRE